MKAVIDRIEDGVAVLLFEEKGLFVNIPIALLPQDVKEGDWLNITWRVDKNTTRDMYRKNKDLLEKLIERNKPQK